MAENKTRLPDREELAQLPRWAKVAFAVRCALRVYPLYEPYHGGNQRVVNAILFAGRAATAAFAATADARTAAFATDVAAAAFATDATDARTAAFAAADAAAAVFADAAAARAAAADDVARAAAADARAAAAAARAAAAAARAVNDAADAASIELIRHAIRSDFLTLQKLTKERGWTIYSPVHPNVLGPLWPNGVPDWWQEPVALQEFLPGATSAPLEPAGVGEPALELYFEPGGASPESVAALMLALSRLHIAAGGAGLVFQPDGGFVHVRERVEA